MKKSLLQILLGVIIGGASFVVLACLLFLQSTLNRHIEVVPIINSVPVVAPSEITTTTTSIDPAEIIAAQKNQYMGEILSAYQFEQAYNTGNGDGVWVGLRTTSTPDQDARQRPLQLWYLDKVQKEYSRPVASFMVSDCGGIEWDYQRATDEVVVKISESPCEAYSEHFIYTYASGGVKWLAKQHSSLPEAAVWFGPRQNILPDPLKVIVNFDKDCNKFPFDEFDSNAVLPTVTMTGLTITQPYNDVKTKRVQFDTKAVVECAVQYGGGYHNPGLTSIDYKNGQLSFGLPDKTLLVIDPEEHRKQNESYLFVDGHTFK